jgi:hypothetical protein
MPAYTWACLACGSSNGPQRQQCLRCACPASATAKQIRQAQQAVELPAEHELHLGGLTPQECTAAQGSGAVLLCFGLFLTSFAAPPLFFALGVVLLALGAWFWHRGSMASNPFIERTAQSPLRGLWSAAHVER